MFEHLENFPADPILKLMGEYQADSRAEKIDLGVGVYKNEEGDTPVLKAVKIAEARILESESTKSYVGPAGNHEFNQLLSAELLGQNHSAISAGRVKAIQTPGGCGALKALADLIARTKPGAKVFVSNPTWANHEAIFSGSGLTVEYYGYYDKANSQLTFDLMMQDLQKAKAGDLVLVHGCCHNPCGADLSLAQWQMFAELANKNGFTPFIDVAYQGFGIDLETDAAGLRLVAEQCPEVLIAASCSKNFGLYRERTGLAMLITHDETATTKALSQLLAATRANYSMPPSHGAAIVAEILSTELKTLWIEELEAMHGRISGLRQALNRALKARGANNFDFIEEQKGMFSFLGLSEAQVARLKSEYAIYMVGSSRINIAGISSANLEYLADSIVAVLE
ncbi:amino acid aminotransferase [uncultured Umboniibacter sp.]|uniref:amino acid aminotransferase n=1 Tax=uncultured Umboniibacter sp. TaxID=1798917 RepID=UPI00262B09E1|nr:amino acid aminotransferase [uncultured Umboniibacter sp.]